MALARTEDTTEAIMDLFIKEQFLNSCPKDLSAHLREKVLADLDEMAKVAEKFLIVHNRRFHISGQLSAGMRYRPHGNNCIKRGTDPGDYRHSVFHL